MSFKVVNKVDRDFKWDNGSNPYGFNVPFPTTEDNGKVLSVVEGRYSLKEDSSNTYTAGTNIQISSENVISATDTTYTAGDNISISDANVISATDTTYTAGENISITNNVISATIPEETVTLLYSLSNNVITDGYGANMPINDDNFDEIIIEIGAIPNMSANQYTLLKGGCWREQNNSMNSKYLRGIKSKVPSESPLWEVIQPYMFDNLVVYSEINDPIDNTKHRFGLYATSYKDNGNTIIALQCVADDINVCLFPNNNVYVWGIKK